MAEVLGLGLQVKGHGICRALFLCPLLLQPSNPLPARYLFIPLEELRNDRGHDAEETS